LKESNFITFLNNKQFGARLGSFGLAVFLWLFVVSNNNYSTIINIPIEVRNLNERKKAYKKEIPQTAKVRFKGKGRSIIKTLLLKDFVKDFKLVIDLDRISEEYNFYLNDYYNRYPQKVSIPSAFELQYVEVIYPDSIYISLDEYMVKNVPIKTKIVINPSPGYIKVDKPSLDSSLVTIAGAKNAIQLIDYIYTVNDTFDNIDIPFNKKVSLERINNTLIEYSFLKVNYSQDIQAISERIITGVPVLIKNNLKGLVVRKNPSTVSLTIVGGINYIAKIEPSDIIVSIDFTYLWSPKKQFYEPKIFVPDQIVSWKDLTPRNIELAVAKESD
jgi:YbbR domain-containing protein